MMKRIFVILLLVVGVQALRSQPADFVWTSQSCNSSESMPCGGGDIGMNVWVENGDLFFYLSRSGTLDEHNCLLKQGRFRIKLSPNPFQNTAEFKQTLKLSDGYVEVKANGTVVQLWADVFRPVVHVEMESNESLSAEVFYENWRYQDRLIRKGEGQQNSYKWAPTKGLATTKDSVSAKDNEVVFFHHNPANTLFDVVVAQQGMEGVKQEMMNPIGNLIFGGKMWGDNLIYKGVSEGEYAGTDFRAWSFASVKPAKKQVVHIALHTAQTPYVKDWQQGLQKTVSGIDINKDRKDTRRWWQSFWQRSYVCADGEAEAISRNYNLFRYMLACNAYGDYPTKFNGGLFTFDPCHVDDKQAFTPDYRKWGGGTMTAQNQRLVYFPMLKNGDFDMLPSQLRFYTRMLRNAELRSIVYWNHSGACFPEQVENFALPNPSEYGWKRPDGFDKGLEYNAWLEYEWDTVLEFCLMALQWNEYQNKNIGEYIPLIESCLTFFDEHYRMLARQRGRKELDGEGHLVLFPGSACETYKMTYNSTSTIAALRVVLEKLIAYPHLSADKKMHWEKMLAVIPPLNFRTINGKETISPARLWERVNNIECPQLYPVFPWRIYGVGKPESEVAVNTYFNDPDALKFRSHIGWKQDNIFAACLGLTDEARKLTLQKMCDGPHRFPAFWGPGYDWTPDHNWGGSGMIGMQEMLLQEGEGGKLLLFPAWPKEWNVRFKLHAPRQTTVEAELKDGKLVNLNVSPKEREKDIINCLN